MDESDDRPGCPDCEMRMIRERDEALTRAENAEAETARLRKLVDEACDIARGLVVIGLDMTNGRTPSISTSEMIRSRADRIAEIARLKEFIEDPDRIDVAKVLGW